MERKQNTQLLHIHSLQDLANTVAERFSIIFEDFSKSKKLIEEYTTKIKELETRLQSLEQQNEIAKLFALLEKMNERMDRVERGYRK